MTGLCLVGIIHKLFLGRYYKKMAYAAENMGLTNKKQLKTMKTKFENSYKLNMNVNNVGAFVDKNMEKQRVCGLPVSFWDKLNLQLTSVCIILGIVGTFMGISNNDSAKTIFTTFTYGILTGAVLVLLEVSVGTDSKRKALKTNIKDYLENYLMHRMSTTADAKVKDSRMAGQSVVVESELKADQRPVSQPVKKPMRSVDDDVEYLKSCLNEIASARNLDTKITDKEEEVLEDILRDIFL